MTTIRQATGHDSGTVAEILSEAARWLDQKGMSMWRADELLPAHVTADVDAGLFFLAECDGAAAGVVKFQLTDMLFWPDVPHAQTIAITGRSYRLKDHATIAGKEDKSKKPSSGPTNLRPQNRRAEWLAIRFCSF